MKNPKLLFDLEAHYRIEVRGRVDVEWLYGLGHIILQVQIIPDEGKAAEVAEQHEGRQQNHILSHI